MKKKILVVLSIMFVFGLVAGVFAISRTIAANEKTAASCRPMHKQNKADATASTEKGDSCCGMADAAKTANARWAAIVVRTKILAR